MLSSSSLLSQLANSLSCALSPTEAEAAEAVAAVKEEEAREAEAEGRALGCRDAFSGRRFGCSCSSRLCTRRTLLRSGHGGM